MTPLQTILNKFRTYSSSERDKGNKFENLIQAYLRTSPLYSNRFKIIWLWDEFPYRNDFSGKDTGIDLVAETVDGDFWAVQCKCYEENAYVDKGAIDSFISTSGKSFYNGEMQKVHFARRLWVSTSNNWSVEAEKITENQNPPFTRISLYDLESDSVNWQSIADGIWGEKALTPKKQIRQHQKDALAKAHEYFKDHERGKLIMACGTGKTFTSLKLVEQETNGKGLILFLVPSIALLNQTLREWAADAEKPIKAICICSDAEASKSKKQDDNGGFKIEDLALPASTNVKNIVEQFKATKLLEGGLTVVFSTYQSIEVVSKAQKQLNELEANSCIFDYIVCDEAHRTTGYTLADEDDSSFVKVHDKEFLKAKHRLYMTATPRLYKLDDRTKAKAESKDIYLCSMDDPVLYGEEVYRIGFGEAVDKKLLSDYKVLILTVTEDQITPILKAAMAADGSKEVDSDDISKLVGCISALSKRMLVDKELLKDSDPNPMKTAIAFCQSIKISKQITGIFNELKENYYETLTPQVRAETVSIESKHIDGTMNTGQRSKLLNWLKAVDPSNNDCRVLTNVKCLSEGVDVPALDAVMFLSAKNSEIDVVQSVGRVMRVDPQGKKKYGYIIIPVLIPPKEKAEDALDDNKRYKVVWTVLNALRAHDDRFNAEINKIELNKKKGRKNGHILVGGSDNSTTSESDPNGEKPTREIQTELSLQFEQLSNVIYARMVQKVGDKRYWEQWAKDIGDISRRNVDKITKAVASGAGAKAFKKFMDGLHKNINPSVTEAEAIEMLAQHIITKPVFEALFENYSFAKSNPVSVAMQKMLDALSNEYLEADLKQMEGFYEQVKKRVEGINTAEGRQKIIIELYDKFFKTALPKIVEKLGIVYTPVEIVDFILHSVDDVLKKEFNRSISDENIHVLDPFTGTGTFISRLIQSGLIKPNDLARKYANELHANEIVLLAYYIASINIENAYHDFQKDGENYKPFDGICLTDTFQLGELDGSDDMFSEMFPQNSERVEKQKKTPLRVIIGNPPYSIGQKSQSDNAQNQNYIKLEKRIGETYISNSDAVRQVALYDSYIKAFRWASDRIDPQHGGIIGFVTNSGWLEKNTMDGFRKCIEMEFSSIYIFNLRGSIRAKSKEESKREGQSVFNIMTGTSIVVLVKKPNQMGSKAKIYYKDIGDYLNRNEKLKIIADIGSIANPKFTTEILTPNEHNDWLNKRNEVFEEFIAIDPEKKFDDMSKSFFTSYSLGVATNRDSWVYNSSSLLLKNNLTNLIKEYEKQKDQYLKNQSKTPIKDFVNYDLKKISWTRALLKDAEKGKDLVFQETSINVSTYRPFFKQNLYFNRRLNEVLYQQSKLFPTKNHKNILICINGIGSRKENSTIITNAIPDLNVLEAGTQCFPLYYYEKVENEKGKTMSLFDQGEDEYIRRDGISDFILKRCREEFGHKVSKEDIFYYVYGLLHSKEYKVTFAADLKKMLPRIPLVNSAEKFRAFSKAGRDLAELHLNYETLKRPDGIEVIGEKSGNFIVDKMRFPSKGEKDTIIYNSDITIKNIPLEAYEYVVNGKSAIEWIMERYQVTINKDSQIKNDPNDWAREHNKPRYILDLLLSIITLSLQSREIINALPSIKEEIGI